MNTKLIIPAIYVLIESEAHVTLEIKDNAAEAMVLLLNQFGGVLEVKDGGLLYTETVGTFVHLKAFVPMTEIKRHNQTESFGSSISFNGIGTKAEWRDGIIHV
jgi:hypothetical protein